MEVETERGKPDPGATQDTLDQLSAACTLQMDLTTPASDTLVLGGRPGGTWAWQSLISFGVTPHEEA